jgi:hypothetical protein
MLSKPVPVGYDIRIAAIQRRAYSLQKSHCQDGSRLLFQQDQHFLAFRASNLPST